MGIVNRRNAVLGWAAWTVGKQVMKTKARRTVRSAPEPKSGGARRRVVAIAVALAALMAVGAFWRLRSGGPEDDMLAPPNP